MIKLPKGSGDGCKHYTGEGCDDVNFDQELNILGFSGFLMGDGYLCFDIDAKHKSYCFALLIKEGVL